MTLIRKEVKDGRTVLFTKNLARGSKVYNEDLRLIEGEEYRTWDPFRSKLAAAMVKGLSEETIPEGARVLYLGVSTGTTASHVSDIIGPEGLLIGVEFAPRVAREFVENVARRRKNVIPFVADAKDPSKYAVATVDVVYCDIAQPDQTEIAMANCDRLLKNDGVLLLVVKARSIDSTKEPETVFKEEKAKLLAQKFVVDRVIDLSPFDKDHAMIIARRKD